MPDWNNTLTNHCLLVIDNNSPLNLAMEVLLVPDSGVQAIKSTARNLQGVADEVHDLKSSVVILEDSAISANGNSLAQILMSNQALKIVVVLRDSNYVYIFRKDEILIENASEFLEIIQSK
jgi:hypothetical protein